MINTKETKRLKKSLHTNHYRTFLPQPCKDKTWERIQGERLFQPGSVLPCTSIRLNTHILCAFCQGVVSSLSQPVNSISHHLNGPPKKDSNSNPDLKRKLSKAGFFFSQASSTWQFIVFWEEKMWKFFSSQYCGLHILEPLSCKIWNIIKAEWKSEKTLQKAWGLDFKGQSLSCSVPRKATKLTKLLGEANKTFKGSKGMIDSVSPYLQVSIY